MCIQCRLMAHSTRCSLVGQLSGMFSDYSPTGAPKSGNTPRNCSKIALPPITTPECYPQTRGMSQTNLNTQKLTTESSAPHWLGRDYRLVAVCACVVSLASFFWFFCHRELLL